MLTCMVAFESFANKGLQVRSFSGTKVLDCGDVGAATCLPFRAGLRFRAKTKAIVKESSRRTANGTETATLGVDTQRPSVKLDDDVSRQHTTPFVNRYVEGLKSLHTCVDMQRTVASNAGTGSTTFLGAAFPTDTVPVPKSSKFSRQRSNEFQSRSKRYISRSADSLLAPVSY
jgi:hypothetical protein